MSSTTAHCCPETLMLGYWKKAPAPMTIGRHSGFAAAGVDEKEWWDRIGQH